jgi:hypothetical protein
LTNVPEKGRIMDTFRIAINRKIWDNKQRETFTVTGFGMKEVS